MMIFDSSFGEQVSFKTTYSDFDFGFKVNPNYGDIMPIKENNAIKTSIKNLILTNFFDRPFNPYVGVGIRDYIFEKMDDMTVANLVIEIKRVVFKYEPRITDIKTYVMTYNDELWLSVVFEVMNTGAVDGFKLPLERLR